MRENNCEYLYLQTALGEVSGEKMPERIAATGQAITARLQEIEHTATIMRSDTELRMR
jgi:hypothetical protein